MKSLRRNQTVAKVDVDKHGRTFAASIKDYDSINLAKKANGLNASMTDKFPPLQADLPVIEEVPAEEAAV